MKRQTKTLMLWGGIILVITSLFLVGMLLEERKVSESIEKFQIESDSFAVETETVIGTGEFMPMIEAYQAGSSYAMMLDEAYVIQNHPNEDFVGEKLPILAIEGMIEAIESLSLRESVIFEYEYSRVSKALYIYRTSDGQYLLIAKDVQEVKDSY